MRPSKMLCAAALFLLGCISFAQNDLFAVARDGSLADVSVFLALDPDVNVTDAYGQTPLMYAATGNEDPDVITVLVDAGADVDAQTLAGWTALMYAVRDNSNPNVALRLLALGADANIQNSDELRALDYAEQNTVFRSSPAYTVLSDASTQEIVEPEPLYSPPAPAAPEARSCCKYCTTGKACGDSCISRSHNCYQGVGCACNASDIDKNDPAYARVQKPIEQAKLTEANPINTLVTPFIDCSFAATFDNLYTQSLVKSLALATN